MPHTPYPSSYYAASANPAPPRPELQGEVETDVCVIGAGYTGLSTALFLLENGFKVTVLEAAKVGFGASGRNGGQIVNSYSRDIDVIERTVGKREAQLLGEMAFEGGRIIRERVARYGIQCDLKDGGVFARSRWITCARRNSCGNATATTSWRSWTPSASARWWRPTTI